MNAIAQVKGWCPGALRPMPSGDGLIVRIKPFCGALGLDQTRALAELAERLGNGHMDLTRRANLQFRGLADRHMAELHAALGRLGLIDSDAATEAARNVMVSPLAGLDPTEPFDARPIAAALDRALTSDPRLQALPAKFGLLVDSGGTLSISGERADICLVASGDVMAFGLDTSHGTEWLGTVARDRAAATAIAAARSFLSVASSGRMRDHVAGVRPCVVPLLLPLETTPRAGERRIGQLNGAVGIAAPFGRLEAHQLDRLAALAAEAGAADLRLSPWRSIYIGVRDQAAAQALIEGAQAIGLLVDGDDPLLRIEACPGAPDCASSSVDARADARRVAALAAERGYRGSIHVSGCAKRCARSASSDLTLIGEDGRYRWRQRLIGAQDLPALFGTSDGG